MHRLAALGATLHVGYIVFPGKLGCLFILDLTLVYQISLGANQHDLRILFDSLGEFIDPVPDRVEGVTRVYAV